jgi:putative inorganic carbon (hco3(-)) transporter
VSDFAGSLLADGSRESGGGVANLARAAPHPTRLRNPSALADRWLGFLATVASGVGVVLAVGGVGMGSLPLALAGVALAATGIVILIVGGWLDALALAAISVPLPAIFSDGDVRIAAAAPIAALAIGAWALRIGSEGRPLRVGALPIRSLLALSASFCVAAVFADAPAVAAREVANIAVLGALLVCAVDLLDGNSERQRSLTRLVALLAAGTGVLAVLETIGVIPGMFPRFETDFFRAALGFGQPNGLGLFFALAVPFVALEVGTARTAAGSLFWSGALGVTVLGLAGTFSRGAWLAVLFGVAALLPGRGAKAALRIWAAAIVAIVAVDLVSGGAIRDTVTRTIGDWVIEQRAALFLAGVLMFIEHPLLGTGPGGFAEQVGQYAPLVPDLWDLQDTPHNAFVQMAAEAGALGLICLVAFIWMVARTGRSATLAAKSPEEKRLRGAVLWSFGTILVASMAIWPLAHGTGEAVILVTALACARPSRGAAES